MHMESFFRLILNTIKVLLELEIRIGIKSVKKVKVRASSPVRQSGKLEQAFSIDTYAIWIHAEMIAND